MLLNISVCAHLVRNTERAMLGNYSERQNKELGNPESHLTYVGRIIMLRQWQWVGYISRRSDERWSKRVLEWRPRSGARSVSRQKARWAGDIELSDENNLDANGPRP